MKQRNIKVLKRNFEYMLAKIYGTENIKSRKWVAEPELERFNKNINKGPAITMYYDITNVEFKYVLAFMDAKLGVEIPASLVDENLPVHIGTWSDGYAWSSTQLPLYKSPSWDLSALSLLLLSLRR